MSNKDEWKYDVEISPALKNALDSALDSAKQSYIKDGKKEGVAKWQCCRQLEALNLEEIDRQVTKHSLALSGPKPDAYFVPRAGKLNFEYSYHCMKRVVFKEYGIKIRTVLITKQLLDGGVIQDVDPIDHTVTIDKQKYTQLSMIKSNMFPENAAAYIVCLEGSNSGDKTQDIVYINTISGISDKGIESKYFGSIRESVKLEFNRHCLDQMFRKTAIRHVIRENFVDVVPGIDQDSDEEVYKDTDESQDYAPSELSEEALQDLKDELNKCATVSEVGRWYLRAVARYPSHESDLISLGKARKKEVVEAEKVVESQDEKKVEDLNNIN